MNVNIIFSTQGNLEVGGLIALGEQMRETTCFEFDCIRASVRVLGCSLRVEVTTDSGGV